MKKIIVILFAISVIVAIFIFIVHDRFNTKYVINSIEEKTGLKIELLNNNFWSFFPIITYSNSNIIIKHKDSALTIHNASIQINKNYWPLSPFFINLEAPTIDFEGMEIRNVVVQIKYINNIIHIENLTGNIIEGTVQIEGNIDLDDTRPFNFQGQFNNISLNTLLQQSQVATWNRVNIKLSSPNFEVSGTANEDQNWKISLIGNLPIKGVIYFTSTDEERFGAALLSLLVEKIPSLTSVSQSIDFLLSTYANIPSSLNGTLTLKKGSIESDEIRITNKIGKSIVTGSYNFIENTINGKIYFYEENEIFLEASLQGEIENPQILVAGKVFSDQEEQPMQNIKQLLENGLNSFIDKLLTINE